MHLVENGAPLQRNPCPRTWSLHLRTWIIGFTRVDFMTTYVDGGLGIVVDAFSSALWQEVLCWSRVERPQERTASPSKSMLMVGYG